MQYKNIQSGLILDTPETLSKLPSYEMLFGTVDSAKTSSWLDYKPTFRNQSPTWWCTGYSGVNIGAIFEKYENNQEMLFSPRELFYRTGGSVRGNTLVSTASGMMQGFVLEDDMPTTKPDRWNYTTWLQWKKQTKATEAMLKRGRPYRMKSFAVVTPDDATMRRALQDSPLSIAIGLGSSTYWDEVAMPPRRYSTYHNVVLMDILEDGTRVIMDSMAGYSNFDGIHKLHRSYPILTALSFMDVPDDWQNYQKKALEELFEPALNHYGKKRKFELEVACATAFNQTLKHHPTVSPYASKEWTVVVNALAYGGYSHQDILNHYTNIRRTGKPIFDLNEQR